MTFTIPIRTVSVANLREHWRARAKRVEQERCAVALVMPRKNWLSFLPAVVTLTRIAPRPVDSDNLTICCKSLRDQIADELGLPNDRDPRVEWRYAQERGKPKEYAVRVEIVPK